jgi:hypothetical protein
MTGLVDGHWLGTHQNDPRASALFRRHYSWGKNHRRLGHAAFCPPGQKMVLLTQDCDALFVWHRPVLPRPSGQTGVLCSVFRNESDVLSSHLIAEADALADRRWPGERHFTYVDPTKIRSTNPGFSFLCAGWRRCGTNKDGRLVVLERPPAPIQEERA